MSFDRDTDRDTDRIARAINAPSEALRRKVIGKRSPEPVFPMPEVWFGLPIKIDPSIPKDCIAVDTAEGRKLFRFKPDKEEAVPIASLEDGPDPFADPETWIR